MKRPSPSTLGFFDLPAEIRNNIYELVLSDNEDESVCPFVWQCSPGRRKYGYSLTQTCQQIRSETLHMWHASNKLVFAMRADNMDYYRKWLKRRPDEIFASIRRLQLDDYQHCKVKYPFRHSTFCKSSIRVNLTKATPAAWRRDRNCFYCPEHDSAVDRVNATVRKLKWEDGRWLLTRQKLEEIFEAAAWEA